MLSDKLSSVAEDLNAILFKILRHSPAGMTTILQLLVAQKAGVIFWR
jgi:hypothetical protein